MIDITAFRLTSINVYQEVSLQKLVGRSLIPTYSRNHIRSETVFKLASAPREI